VNDAGDERMIYWRRLDVPGAELARVSQAGREHRIEGAVLVVCGGQPYDLRYTVACDEQWRTRRAAVRGTAAGETVRLDIVADTAGGWQLNGVDWTPVAGCLDVDLGFTPSTNLLPVRRLGLGVGEESATRAAWLRFPELRFEPLAQLYRREAEHRYRYESNGGRFVASLDVDSFGLVTRYGDYWIAESTRAEAVGGAR
jgi:hypothetical protein